MRFKDLINDVEARLVNTEQTTRVKEWINQAQDEIQVFFDWPFLIKEKFLQTVAEHTTGTGTIGVTNGSTAVTGTGTSWTAAMTGRKFRITGDNEWYTFTYVSGRWLHCMLLGSGGVVLRIPRQSTLPYNIARII